MKKIGEKIMDVMLAFLAGVLLCGVFTWVWIDHTYRQAQKKFKEILKRLHK